MKGKVDEIDLHSRPAILGTRDRNQCTVIFSEMITGIIFQQMEEIFMKRLIILDIEDFSIHIYSFVVGIPAAGKIVSIGHQNDPVAGLYVYGYSVKAHLLQNSEDQIAFIQGLDAGTSHMDRLRLSGVCYFCS